MYKYNLKLDPELARQRHNEQNRAWYKRNKEKVMGKQRIYRARKKLQKQELINNGQTEVFRYTTEVLQTPRSEYVKELLARGDPLRNVWSNKK